MRLVGSALKSTLASPGLGTEGTVVGPRLPHSVARALSRVPRVEERLKRPGSVCRMASWSNKVYRAQFIVDIYPIDDRVAIGNLISEISEQVLTSEQSKDAQEELGDTEEDKDDGIDDERSDDRGWIEEDVDRRENKSTNPTRTGLQDVTNEREKSTVFGHLDP